MKDQHPIAWWRLFRRGRRTSARYLEIARHPTSLPVDVIKYAVWRWSTLFRPLIQIGRAHRGIQPSDTYLVSYPRSGNTWVRYMLAQLHPSRIDTPTPVPDLDTVIPDGTPVPDTPPPRVIKSHSLYTPLFPRVIYLLRDGRDCTLSNYRLHSTSTTADLSFLDYLQREPNAFRTEHARDVQWPCRWHHHVESWTQQSYVPTLVVRFEDLKSDTEHRVRRMLSFLGWIASDAQIDQAIANSTLERMKRVEQQGMRDLNQVGQGQAEGWTTSYSQAELDCFMAYAGDTLEHLGYPIDVPTGASSSTTDR